MNEYETKSCGWKLNHEAHHIDQLDGYSYNCPGYDVEAERVLAMVSAGKMSAWKPEVNL